MDIFQSASLNGIVRNLKRPQTFLLDNFFRGVVQSEAEEIYFDVENGKRRISPFVSPLREGKVVQGLGYSTNKFKPAYVKDKRVFDSTRPLKRAIGEQIGGNALSGAQRQQALLVQELGDQTDMLQRRLELMAAEALRTGKIVISGDGFDEVEVDFGRDVALTDALTGTSEWGDTGVKPLDTIEDMSLVVLQKSGAVITDVIMDIEAWKLFRVDETVRQQLDLQRANIGAAMDLVRAPALGGQMVGVIGQYRIWLYNDWYIDPDTGTETKMLPDYTVLMVSQQLEGVRHFGAIRDEEAGFQAMEMYAKSWVTKDPSVRYLLMQSAPLVVPYRPNASACVTVKG